MAVRGVLGMAIGEPFRHRFGGDLSGWEGDGTGCDCRVWKLVFLLGLMLHSMIVFGARPILVGM